jgi:hypothetical protein
MLAIDFCAQLSVYRLSLPPDLFEEPARLIPDGHISRANITALMIFCLFNVDILILLGHTTHVLQPFDVGIASPLKSEFKQQLMEEVNALRMEMIEGQLTKADALRCQVIAAFLNAFHKVTTPGNLYSALETTGFVSFSPTRPLEYPFVAAAPAGVFDEIVRRTNGVSAELPIDFDFIQRLFEEQNDRIMIGQYLSQMYVNAIWSGLMTSQLANGRILTSRPKIWVTETEDRVTVL